VPAEDRARLLDLGLRQFSAEHCGREPLTDVETRELAELERRFPPDPTDPLNDAFEAWRRPPRVSPNYQRRRVP
jgi:hypothetical protein